MKSYDVFNVITYSWISRCLQSEITFVVLINNTIVQRSYLINRFENFTKIVTNRKITKCLISSAIFDDDNDHTYMT